MARALVATTTANAPNPTAGVVVTMTAADATNFNYIVLTGKTLILFYNSGATARTYTINSGPDERGRTVSITADAIAAGAIEHVVVEPFGWVQSGTNQLFVAASHAEVLIAAIAL